MRLFPTPLLLQKNLPKLTSLLLTMPKNPTTTTTTTTNQLPHLQAVRRKNKETMTLYPPGQISLQPLGSSLYLFTDQTRYLFNCGEGTQRLAHEHKLKLAKLNHVFLTSGRWERVGGLMGVALTVQDIGVERVWVHGPPGVNRLFTTARRFIILKDLEITTLNTLSTVKTHTDHILTISYINIHSTLNETIAKTQSDPDPTDYYSAHRSSHNHKMITVNSDESILTKDVAVQYGIHFKAKEGQLLIDKCIERGVPAGPLLGRLKAGEDVELQGGVVVRAEDVRGGGDQGCVVLVLDCPTPAHLPAFLSSKDIAKYHDPSTFTHTVVHFTPLDVLQSEEYLNFLKLFPISTNHLIINEGVLVDAHEAVHRMQAKLNVIDDSLFPLYRVKEKKRLELGVKSFIGETGMRVALRGNKGSNDVEGPPYTIHPATTYQQELLTNPAFVQELDLFKQSRPPITKKTTQNLLLFLGTGSSIPNKTRNVSSIYLEIDDHSSILFDCGEGTLQQLQRFDNYEHYLKKLKIIYLSHLHADHHLGLFSFLKLKKLIVIAPRQIKSWVEGFRDFDCIDYELLPSDGFLSGQSLSEYGIDELKTCYVRHCPNSFGVAVTINNKKITYSGDTLPSEELVKLGYKSDVLIHEATMEDGLEKDALLKMHCTVGQAVDISKKMEAKFLILTHFSQRYSKVPLIEGVGGNVGVAFDGLVVGLDSVGRLGGMGGVLREGWREDVEEMEGRREKRGRREMLIKGVE